MEYVCLFRVTQVLLGVLVFLDRMDAMGPKEIKDGMDFQGGEEPMEHRSD